jgi:molecular chaperone GrpE (heat shock protein)
VTEGDVVTGGEPGGSVTSEVAAGSESVPDPGALVDAGPPSPPGEGPPGAGTPPAGESPPDAAALPNAGPHPDADTAAPADAGTHPDAETAADADLPTDGEPEADGDELIEADAETDADSRLISDVAEVMTGLTALGGRLDDLAATAAELARLRSRDTDLIDRLHQDVTRLRTGEIAAALSPVVTGMIKLHDQMVSLGALSDPASPVGMLHTQLLQVLELTCGIRPFTPAAGDQFDPSRHTGTRRIPTTDASADGTIASTIKAGFARADGSVVRVAEVEVHRLSA